jgi:hypothetical protein
VIEFWILLASNYFVWCAELFNSRDGNQRARAGERQECIHYLPAAAPLPTTIRITVWVPAIYITLDPLRSPWLESDLQRKPTGSKLSHSGYRQLTQIILRQNASFSANTEQKLK